MTLKDLYLALKKPSKEKQFAKLQEDADIERQERQIQIELHKIQLQQLKRIKAREDFASTKRQILEPDILEDEDEDEDDDEDMIIKLLSPIISPLVNKGQGTPSPPQKPLLMSNGEGAYNEYSDTEIQQYINGLSPLLKQYAGMLSKEDFQAEMRKQAPNVDNRTIERAYNILHKGC